jgi:hypothetical protein
MASPGFGVWALVLTDRRIGSAPIASASSLAGLRVSAQARGRLGALHIDRSILAVVLCGIAGVPLGVWALNILTQDTLIVHTLLVDNGYQKRVAERAERAGIDLVVSQKPKEVKGFQPTPR